jgi:hypothetical protein
MGTVSRVHTFSAGSVLTAAQLNNEFDNLLTSSAINGGLDATNLGVTAGQITASKALVVDSSRNLDDTTSTNMINNLTLSGTLKLIDDQALTLGTNDDITVKYDETTNDALEIAAAVEGAALAVVLKADQGDDAGDEWKLGVADGGVLTLGNDIASAGTYVTGLTITPNSTTAAWLLDFEGDVDVGGDTLSFNAAATIDTSGNNNLTLSAGTADVVVTASNLAPASNDGSAIGVSGTAWSDLFLASGAVVNFNAGDVTLTHSSNTLTVAGGTLATAALTASTITASGIIKTDDTTEATSTADGSLQTDGGLSVVKDAVFGDDVKLLSDSAVLALGDGSDATLTHDGTTGVTIAANPITVDSGAALTLDAHTGVFVFKDAGSEVLRFTEGNSGDVTVKLATDGKDLVFTDNGDATGLKILDAAAGINVPGEVQTTGIGYTDGDNAITIADGGGITVPQASTFSAAITVTDTTAPLILKYDAQEYVTHAVSSAGVYSITTTDASSDSGAITLDTVDSITLDSDTATEGIVYADSGTNLLRIHNASSDVVFKPLVDAKDIVFQQYDGNEVCRIADNRRLYLYDEGGEYISSNGTALTIASGGVAWEWPVADGSDGQVLKTDSSGNLDWVSQSSGISFDGSTANGMLTYKDSDEATVESNLTYDGTDMLMTSSSTNKPVVTLKNTHNGATGAYLKFVNDKGAAGADNDVCGTITFYGDDDNQDNIEFARIEGVVADASNGDECGALKLYVAENDGNNTVGLSLTGSTTDGEVDATIGAGSASVVTVPGHIDLAGDIDVDGTLETDALTIGGTTLLANDSNNRVTTATGSGTLNGEANLTFDGNDLFIADGGGMVIGHTSQLSPVGYPPELQVLGTGDADTQLALARYNNGGSGCQMSITKSRATSVGGSNAIVQDGDQLGIISWQGDDGTTTDSRAAAIEGYVDGTPGVNDMPGRLVFSTAADGASSPTERLRINNNGVHTINATETNSFPLYINNNTTGNAYGLKIDLTQVSPDNNAYSFLHCEDSTAIRTVIYTDGDVWTSDAGTLTSDSRLKTNIVDATSKLADVMRLKVRNYEWVPEYHPAKVGEKKIGFIAQELEEVFPSLITEHDIAPDNSVEEQLYTADDDIPDGKSIGDVKVAGKTHEPVMRKSYKDAFTPILVKALQEVTARLEAAEAKIAALEAA